MAPHIFVFLFGGKKLAVLFLMFALVSCTPISAERGSSVSASPPTASSGSCPVTPIQTDFWKGVGPVAGEFPIWITSRGRVSWSQLGPKKYPPDSIASDFVYGYGRGTKTLIFVDQTAQGDLTITGRRLDEEGTVYFPKAGESSQLAGSNESQLNVVPSEVGIIVGAHTLSRLPNPPGMAHHGFGPFYPNPGCYELTAAIEEHEVRIVIEITDS